MQEHSHRSLVLEHSDALVVEPHNVEPVGSDERVPEDNDALVGNGGRGRAEPVGSSSVLVHSMKVQEQHTCCSS